MTRELPWQTHTSTLPLFDTQPFPSREEAFATAHQVRKNPIISHRKVVSQQRADNGDNRDHDVQEIRDGKPPTRPKENILPLVNTVVTEHENRNKELLELLGPMFASENGHFTSLLLCWGRPDRSRIFPIKINYTPQEFPYSYVPSTDEPRCFEDCITSLSWTH